MGHRSLRRFPIPKIFSSRIFVGYPQKILQYPIFGSTALISIVCVWFLRFQYQIPSYNENMFKQQISWSDLNSRQNSEIQLMFQSNPAATEMYFQPSSLKHEKLPTPTRVLSLATMPPPPLWEQIDTNGLTRASPHYRLIRPDDYGLFSCAGWALGVGGTYMPMMLCPNARSHSQGLAILVDMPMVIGKMVVPLRWYPRCLTPPQRAL